MSQDIVKAVRLVTGEEILAFIEEASDYVYLSRPRVMQIMPDGQGNFGLALMPWFSSDKDVENVKVKAEHVVAVIPVPTDVETGYRQNVTPIVLAGTGNLGLC